MTRRSAVLVTGAATLSAQQPEPVRVLVAGLTHGHAAGMLRKLEGRTDIKLAGIAERRREVAERYAKEFRLEASLLHSDLKQAIAATRPKAVMAFSDTFDHKEIVEVCAAHKVPVMVEKPLAVSMEHARTIEQAARSAGIPVLVNYETTWYPSMHRTRDLVREGRIGTVNKLVVRDGHKGPKEIGVPPEFLEWLTDPVRNGAGALFDFGCYGANLATWFFDGVTPHTVLATTQTFKPQTYGKVDDDATIILTYDKAQVLIQASWNWPYSRKDLDAYGTDGYLLAPDRQTLLLRSGTARENKPEVPSLTNEHKDELTYLVAVIQGRTDPEDGLSSMRNNLVVTRILTAARDSARTGRAVRLRS